MNSNLKKIAPVSNILGAAWWHTEQGEILFNENSYHLQEPIIEAGSFSVILQLSGIDVKSPLLLMWEGSVVAGSVVTSTKNVMYMQFTSSMDFESEGFDIQYNTIPCKFLLNYDV